MVRFRARLLQAIVKAIASEDITKTELALTWLSNAWGALHSAYKRIKPKVVKIVGRLPIEKAVNRDEILKNAIQIIQEAKNTIDNLIGDVQSHKIAIEDAIESAITLVGNLNNVRNQLLLVDEKAAAEDVRKAIDFINKARQVWEGQIRANNNVEHTEQEAKHILRKMFLGSLGERRHEAMQEAPLIIEKGIRDKLRSLVGKILPSEEAKRQLTTLGRALLFSTVASGGAESLKERLEELEDKEEITLEQEKAAQINYKMQIAAVLAADRIEHHAIPLLQSNKDTLTQARGNRLQEMLEYLQGAVKNLKRAASAAEHGKYYGALARLTEAVINLFDFSGAFPIVSSQSQSNENEKGLWQKLVELIDEALNKVNEAVSVAVKEIPIPQEKVNLSTVNRLIQVTKWVLEDKMEGKHPLQVFDDA